MTAQPTPHHKKASFVNRLLDYADTASAEKLHQLVDEYQHMSQQEKGTLSLESMAMLDLLEFQIDSMGSISPEVIQKSCAYILQKMLPYDKGIQYKIAACFT